MIRHPPAFCPFCDHLFDAVSATDRSDKSPEDGDFSLCFNCGEWLVLTDRMTSRRKPTDAEYLEIGSDSYFSDIRAVWQETKEQLAREPRGEIEALWQAYAEGLLDHLGPKAQQVTKDAFYAGAYSMLVAEIETVRAASREGMSMAGMHAMLDRLKAELDAYARNRKRQR